MTQPPAGSSLLFGALADTGRIKQRKNGSYRMVLKGVDEIDWFTDRPFRSEGLWKPKKLISQWDSLFESSDPNAQASFRIGDERELMTFEMFKPKYNSKKQILSFKLDAGIINNRESDLVTGLKGKALDEVTLFIDDATLGASSPNSWVEEAVIAILRTPRSAGSWDLSVANLSGARLGGAILNGANLYGANLTGANLSAANLRGADLYGAYLYYANLSDADLYGANLNEADLTLANLSSANLSSATYDSATIWPTAEHWKNTTCPDRTNSDSNPSCGF